MIKATINDKKLVIKILYDSFVEILIPNSINFTIKKGAKRHSRLMVLMEYQFNMSLKYGEIFISDDRKGCILYIDRKYFSFQKIFWELRLLFKCIGIENTLKTLRRENILESYHPKEKFKHLWLMGVMPNSQGGGIGSQLLQETLQRYEGELIYVETTTPENLRFYKKNNFEIFHETLELDYPLYFLRHV